MDNNSIKKLPYKRILQVILFSLLPIVDFGRTSTNEWQMMLSAQFVGMVLAGVMVLHYGIKRFVKWYNLLWIGAAGIAIYTMPYWFYEEAIKYHYLYETWFAIVNIAFIGMIVTQALIDVFQKSRPISLKKIDKGSILLFVLWFLYILSATLMRDNSFRPEFDLIYFGVFYFVSFTKEELKELFDDLLNGILLGFSVLQVIAFFFRPYVDGFMRYRGMYYNSNFYDLMCLLVLAAVLFKLTQSARNKVGLWRYALWLLYYGVVFSLIVLSIGRMSILLAVGITVVYGFIIYICEKISWKEIAKKAGALFIAICIALPLTFLAISYLPRVLDRPIIYQGEEKLLGDLSKQDNYVSADEVFDALAGRFAKLVDQSEEDVVKEEPKSEDVEPMDPDWENKTYYLTTKEYSGVELRTAIWRTYVDELNMTGHTEEHWHLWVSPYFEAWHPHNVFLMQLYVYGIPVGSVFVIWIIFYLCMSFKCIVSDKKQESFRYTFFVILLLFGFGTFDTCWMNGQMFWVLLMFMQKYLLSNKKLITAEEGEING